MLSGAASNSLEDFEATLRSNLRWLRVTPASKRSELAANAERVLSGGGIGNLERAICGTRSFARFIGCECNLFMTYNLLAVIYQSSRAYREVAGRLAGIWRYLSLSRREIVGYCLNTVWILSANRLEIAWISSASQRRRLADWDKRRTI